MSSRTESASSELTSGQRGFQYHHAENRMVAPLMHDLSPVKERLSSGHKIITVKSYANYNDKQSITSPTSVTGVIPKMQLFVRSIGTRETYIVHVPRDITVEGFIETAFIKMGLSTKTPATLTLRGKEIKASSKNLIQEYGVCVADTLTLTSGKLLGGSQVPLLEKEETSEYGSKTASGVSLVFDPKSTSQSYRGPELAQESAEPVENLKLMKKMRAMTVQQLENLVQSNQKADYLNLVQNCERQQIDELQKVLNYSEKSMLEAAQLELFLGTQIEQDVPKLLSDLDDVPREIDLKGTIVDKESVFEIMRTSNQDSQQLLVLTEFVDKITCYTFQDDATWSKPMQRSYQLKLYDLDNTSAEDDEAFWDLQTAINLDLQGEVIYGLRLVRNSPTSDVAFLLSDDDEDKIDLNIIPNGQLLSVNTFSIPASCELHKLLRETESDSQHKFSNSMKTLQFMMDRDNMLMILYETEKANTNYVNFYDVDSGATIIRVRDQMKLLYMHPIVKMNQSVSAVMGSVLLSNRLVDLSADVEDLTDDLCIFNNCSYRIDFSDVRAKYAQDSKSVEISKKTNEVINEYKVDLSADAEIVDWRKENSGGFAISSYDGDIEFYEAWKTSEQIPKKPEYTRQAEQKPLPIQMAVYIWETRNDLSKVQLRFNETENSQVETCQHLLLVSKIGQSTIFVCNMSTQQICGFTFPGQIITFGIVLWDNDPAKKQRMMNVLIDDRVVKTGQISQKNDANMHMVYVKFGADQDLMKRLAVSQREVPALWNKDIAEMTTVKPGDLKEQQILCNVDSQLEWLFLRTATKVKSFFVDQEKQIMTHYANEKEFQIRDTNWLKWRDQIIFIVHEKDTKKDLVVAVDQNGNPECILHRISSAYAIQCCLVEGIVYIVDSTCNLIRLFLSTKPDGKPRVTFSDSYSMQSIDQIKTLQSQAVRMKVHMTDQTIIFDDKIIQISKVKGRKLPKDLINAKITLVPGMLISQHLDPDNDTERLVVRSNPDSRRLPIGDAAFRQHLRSFHQLSNNLLLIERHLGKWQQWALVKTDGTRCEISSELKKVLKGDCNVQSFTNLSNMCNLILTYRTSGSNAILKAEVLEITRSGVIASQRDLKLSAAKQGVRIAEDKILTNYRGDMLQVRIFNKKSGFWGQTSEPEYKQGDGGIDGAMNLISFKNSDKSTEMAYTGNFFCWTGDLQVHTRELSTGITKIISLTQFSHFAGKWTPALYEIQASNPKSLLEAGWLKTSTVEMQGLEELGDHLQVTIGKHARIYNLRPKKPVAVSEMNDMDELFDPCSFIQTGFQLVSCSETADFGYSKKCLKVSPLQNLLIETRDSCDFSIYRRFATTDIVDTQDFLDQSEHEISISTLWADFFDNSLLKMIETGSSTPLERIHDRFNNEVAKNVSADKLETMEGKRMRLQLRRVNFWLQKKLVIYQEKTDQLQTISLLSKTMNQPSQRDLLLKIGQHSPEFSLISTFVDQGSMGELADNMSSQVIDSLSKSFIQTGSMKKIVMLDWPTDQKGYFVQMSDTLEISQDELNSLLKKSLFEKKKDYKCNSRPVVVELLNLSWFFAGKKNFIAFSMILNQMPAEFYSTKLIVLMLDTFWRDAQKKMIRRQAIPYVMFCSITVLYFHNSLSQEMERTMHTSHEWTADRYFHKSMGGLVSLLLLYSVWIEVKQLISKKNKCEYFLDPYNYLDVAGQTLTAFILVVTLSDREQLFFDFAQLRVMASIAVCLLLFKLFDWLRLFDRTAFYILLIENTMLGIRGFMLVFLLALITFGLPMHMLDFNRSDDKIVGDNFDFWVLDAIYNQYLLSLGQFNSLDSVGVGQSEDWLVVLFFSLATFFTQITMLNMLIAIMGDSFDNATENKENYIVMTKLEVLKTQAPSLPLTETKDEKKVFMIIAKPADDDDDDSGWLGTINKVSTLVNKSINGLQQDMKMAMSKQQSEIVTAINAGSVDVASVKDQVQQIKLDMTETGDKVEAIKKMMVQHIAMENARGGFFKDMMPPPPTPDQAQEEVSDFFQP